MDENAGCWLFSAEAASEAEPSCLRPGTSYRVSVRARPLGGGLGVDDGAPEGTRGWAGWCTSLDVQTAATASNPAPLIESPAEGEEVTLGEALEIRWTGPQVRCPSVAPSPWCQWQRVVAWAALTRGLVCAQRVLGAYVCNHTGLCHRTLEANHGFTCEGEGTGTSMLSWDGQLWEGRSEPHLPCCVRAVI